MTKKLLITLLCFSGLFSFSQENDSAEFKQYFYKSGELSSEGNLSEGNPVGYWKSYYKNGNLKTEGNRLGEDLDGQWKFYNEVGQLTLIITYGENKKNGDRITFHENGKEQRKELYENDKKEGLSTEYYSNGNLIKQVPFVNGREQGIGLEYDQKGAIITLLTFKSGVMVKERYINRFDKQGLRKGSWMEFYPNLQAKNEGLYKLDLKHGYWKYYKSDGNLLRIEKWVNGVLIPEDQIAGKLEIKREREKLKNSNKPICFEDSLKRSFPLVSVLLTELVKAVFFTCMEDSLQDF